MSTQSLRELVEAVKAQGKTLAEATGANAASARDLVYLSTSVERLFGADAILELIDSAARPVEHREIALANVQAETLTVDQVSKQVIRYTNTSPSYTATEFTVTCPNRGVAFVIDNEMPVPLKVKTSAQTVGQGIPEVGANKTAWVFCDGETVQHVIDVEAIKTSITTPTENAGDMIYRAGEPDGAVRDYFVYVRNYGGQNHFYFRPKEYRLGSPNVEEKTPRLNLYPGTTYRFYQEDDSNDGHLFKLSTTKDGIHAATPGVELLDINGDATNDITYVGTPGSDGAYTQVVVPTSGTLPTTVYYYNHGASGFGGDGMFSVVEGNNVTKLPIGDRDQFLSVSREGDRPEWRNVNEVASPKTGCAAPAWEYTGLWSNGRYRLANHITDSTTFTHCANVGTYDAWHGNMQAYRGASALAWHNGRTIATAWGSGTEGRNGSDTNKGNGWFTGTPQTTDQGGYWGPMEGHTPGDERRYDSEVKFICHGYAQTAFVDANGDVWVAGHGDEGQIGDGQNSDRSTFHRARFPSDAGPCRYVTHSGTHGGTAVSFFALMEDGDVYSWGYNGYGQLGHGDTSNRNIPTKIGAFDRNIRSIVACNSEYAHVAALTTDNRLYCWGQNDNGQIGNGGTTDQMTPFEVNVANQDVAKVVVDGSHNNATTYAITANGRLYAWGYNGHANIGDGSTSNRSTPTLVSNLGLEDGKYVIDVWSVGGYYGPAFALTNNGDMYAWANNQRGYAAVGNTNNYLQTPTLCDTRLKWVSDINSSGNTSSSSYPYLAVSFISHDNMEDRRDRVNGTHRTCGYSQQYIGNESYPTNKVLPYDTNLPGGIQGRIRFGMSGGYHSGSTIETNNWVVDMDGGLWGWGYAGDGAVPHAPSSARPMLITS